MPDRSHSSPEHPSPQRHEVAWWRLAIGLIGAPLMWMIAMLVGFGLSDVGCGRIFGIGPLAVLTMVASVIVSALCNWMAWSAWRLTRAEAKGGGKEAIDTGEGRSRFFAITGIWSSAIFAAASLFTLIAVIMVPPC